MIRRSSLGCTQRLRHAPSPRAKHGTPYSSTSHSQACRHKNVAKTATFLTISQTAAGSFVVRRPVRSWRHPPRPRRLHPSRARRCSGVSASAADQPAEDPGLWPKQRSCQASAGSAVSSSGKPFLVPRRLWTPSWHQKHSLPSSTPGCTGVVMIPFAAPPWTESSNELHRGLFCRPGNNQSSFGNANIHVWAQ